MGAAQATIPLARQAATATRHAGGQSGGRSSNGCRLAGTEIEVRAMVFDHGTLLGGRYTTRRESGCADLIRLGPQWTSVEGSPTLAWGWSVRSKPGRCLFVLSSPFYTRWPMRLTMPATRQART